MDPNVPPRIRTNMRTKPHLNRCSVSFNDDSCGATDTSLSESGCGSSTHHGRTERGKGDTHGVGEGSNPNRPP